MRRLFLALVIAVPVAWSAPETQTKKPKAQAKKSASKSDGDKAAAPASLTGCLDQRGETYVLRELGTAGTVSTLKGKVFSDDNFARYVGHKVTVHGTLQKQGQTSVMLVTKVDDAGPGCSDR
jgi:hypothetical protein